MCGIVGVIPKQTNGFYKKHMDVFSNMLYAGALRGWDSTGVIGVMKDGDFGIMKEATPSAYFQYNYNDSELDKKVYSVGAAAIGHNRAKTVGLATDENAHPFVIDDTFAMVHNGTLRNHHKLAKTTVDSEALAIVIKEAMETDDWKGALEKTLSSVEGAYAVVWYDQQRHEVCMVRNKERPLMLLETEDGVIFASEHGMANWCAVRNGFKVTKAMSVPEDTLIRFDLKKGGALYEQIPLALSSPKGTTGFSNGITKPTNGSTQTVVPGTTSETKGTASILRHIFKQKGQEEVSKNMYKRLRNKIIGKHLIFEQVDWVEVDIMDVANNTKYVILGESKNGSYDLCDFKHIVKTIIDIKELKLTQEEVDFHTNWVGIVKDMSFDVKTKSMEILLEKTIPSKPTLVLTNNKVY